MNWTRLPLGPLQTNGYLLDDGENAVMIDPGGDVDRINEALNKKDLTLKEIWLTHAHFDHIGALEELRNDWSAEVYIHAEEAQWLEKPELNGSGLFPGIEPVSARPAECTFPDEGTFTSAGFKCELFYTPGHSPGSVSFYFPEENVVFSGDVLFRGGIGRTDLPGGDYAALMASIEAKMLALPDETEVANGHGPTTTIKDEKETNPFINSFGW
ncbi:MBL fold metallo-hydrolase [Salisediminibacterium halotolerans]|uniref:Glyoxylase, beta-lactamase superfamily II n=1 Tax=Salisediminibacterium halotolerans TaxID=517425 RepID=A0A1H9SAV7_9BACI|nr:MBL fold metallo-hydrolase [Salisediminibacterium haloalkalitolerans]SER82127.1 Glyoxylase, beta-lactamase superfamily II [Salisediminibacterium haloalkalitolerans]